MNWIIKQIFYCKYFLGRGDPTPDYQNYVFFSKSFDDLQWNRYLPWYSEGENQDWNTYGIFAKMYGKFQFEVRLDGLVTQKQWPALWLLEISDNYYYEIDAELLKNDLSFTIHVNHTGEQDKKDPNYHAIAAKLRNKRLYRNLQKDFHLFLIDWNKEWIKFYINGILCARFRNEIHIPMQIICSKISMNKVIVQK